MARRHGKWSFRWPERRCLGRCDDGIHLILMKVSILIARSRGAALMLALWALFLLSAMVISWALDINSRLTLSGNANRVLGAEAMASSGADVALHPSIAPGSPNRSEERRVGKECTVLCR